MDTPKQIFFLLAFLANVEMMSVTKEEEEEEDVIAKHSLI
jgi:hypothetical protein